MKRNIFIISLVLSVGAIVLGCKKEVAAPAPVVREMRLKINGRPYTWPCRAGIRDVFGSFITMEGGEPQGGDGISITYEEQPSYPSPKPYKPVRATLVLNGVTYRITGIGTSTSHVNYLLGTYSEDEAANKIVGTFEGEENQLGIRLEEGRFTTVIH
ncbi:hypothetical protein MON38_14690 [Hymenobacter sp. DH14]|uniref:Uncharacterized protein n=1 Tax=Hymenobacter cyanobacteriorum TaxID=2926463 RepID=A0A9X1VI20_9BACT|nr:hypothetical protein [Hymenobacter cyanobacteriorum]MCI1188672.1 hypothetical protein [Hymenobacter cyanobacteriorum]